MSAVLEHPFVIQVVGGFLSAILAAYLLDSGVRVKIQPWLGRVYALAFIWVVFPLLEGSLGPAYSFLSGLPTENLVVLAVSASILACCRAARRSVPLATVTTGEAIPSNRSESSRDLPVHLLSFLFVLLRISGVVTAAIIRILRRRLLPAWAGGCHTPRLLVSA